MPRKRSVLSGDEVDLLYDWLERASGLPPELCASDFRSTFPPERLFAATCALLLVMDESRALLPASDLETWLLGVLEALSVDLFGNDTSRRHSDAAPVRTEDGALLPSRTLSFSTSSALVDQFVLCLAPVELAEQQVAVASANAPRSPPDRASCLDLAKAILCRVPCTSMLAFRTPPSGRRRPSSERLKWDYTLCFNERRAMRMSGLMSLAISSSISDAHEKELLQGMEAVPGAVLILAPPTDQWAGFVEKSPDLAVFVARELLKFTAGLE
ncbi:hypothetical protein DFJ74DRAFT_314748 [Hyaloraphidium curvatum]|nr:hypothetical protein DFJ74DRAFT_314748 [Hyaloraphidium curvatum]